jgi:integrase
MRCMSADVHQFARFVKVHWPEVKMLDQVTPDMAQAYIDELVRRERSGGRIGRVCASLRKLDAASRQAGIFTAEAPPLLPYKEQGGPGGFHAEPRPVAYPPNQTQAIIDHIQPKDPAAARVLTLMLVSGLRITETCWLRAQDIDLEVGIISLNKNSNINRTKGGRPRVVVIHTDNHKFLQELKARGIQRPTGHIFSDRRALPDRVRAQVRRACQALEIPCLGTHGFRKTFAVDDYHRHRQAGAGQREALLKTSQQLGHNRAIVTRQSYVSSNKLKE